MYQFVLSIFIGPIVFLISELTIFGFKKQKQNKNNVVTYIDILF